MFIEVPKPDKNLLESDDISSCSQILLEQYTKFSV